MNHDFIEDEVLTPAQRISVMTIGLEQARRPCNGTCLDQQIENAPEQRE